MAEKCHIVGYAYDPGQHRIANAGEGTPCDSEKQKQNRFRYLTNKFGFAFTEEEKREIETKERPGKTDFKELVEKKLKQSNPEGKTVTR